MTITNRFVLSPHSVYTRLLLCVVRTAAVAILLIVATPPSNAQQREGLAVVVGEGDISIRNTTPRGAIVLFTCSRGSRAGRTFVVSKTHLLRDDDGDGAVQFVPPGGVLLRSVWVAVDYTSGAVVAAAHSRFPLNVREFTAAAFRKNAEGAIEQLAEELRRVTVLVVRPGTGAWTLLARDGKNGDHDRSANARVTVSFAAARAVEGKAAAPKHLKADDVVVAVDLTQLDVFIARIGK